MACRDPALGIMFFFALVTNTVLHRLVLKVLDRPLFAPKFSIPTRTDLTSELFAGSALFGMGWGLAGYCPGPGIVASIDGNPKTLLFLVAMAVGMGLFKLQQALESAPDVKKDDDAARDLVHPHRRSAAASFAVLLAMATIVYLYSVSGHDGQRVTVDPVFISSPVMPIIGGVLVGASVSLMMALVGQILGIAGIVNGLFSTQAGDKAFRASFVAGLVVASLFVKSSSPDLLVNHMHRSWPFFVAGGFFVGYGTSLGSGCTSGHGIAGLARLSPRSIAAVATFFAANMAVTTMLHSVGVGTGWKQALDAAAAGA